MTSKEYLRQAYRLDQKIDSYVEEAAKLHELSKSISSARWGDKVQTSHNMDAPFVRCVEKIMMLEEKIHGEVELLINLKRQICDVIDAVPDTDERLVLRYRYINNLTWRQIGGELRADKSTIRRWHGSALAHVVLPDNPIKI